MKDIYEIFMQAYWRTCAFLLGAVIEQAFTVDVQLVGPSKADCRFLFLSVILM